MSRFRTAACLFPYDATFFMSRFHSHLNSAVKMIQLYDGVVPLSVWLKDFFRQHKQMGSKDRKQVSELVYSYHRIGHALPEAAAEEKIFTGLFLCNQDSHEFLQYFRPAWNEAMHISLEEKVSFVHAEDPSIQLRDIFPWQQELSEGIDASLFNLSFLQQPDVFIRIRPGHEEAVRQKLNSAGVPYHTYSNNCIGLPHAIKLQQLLDINREAVIQDYSSQQTGNYFFDPAMPAAPMVWDCCAASGGKSIMAHDLRPSVQLTVSDIRRSILHNMEIRFQEAGLQGYRSFLFDLSVSNARLPAENYDLVIADVPCSGSGTWARTPEQLAFFQTGKIDTYHAIQKKIVSNVAGKLKKEGKLVYITCSVFKKENEDIVQFMKEELHLKVDVANTLKGYDRRADSMFVAVLRK